MSDMKKIVPLVLLFSLLMVNVAYAGIGLSPASIEFYNMTRGGYAEKYLTVSNPSDETVRVTVGCDGDIKEFLTFHPDVFNLTGGSYKIVKINVTTPIDIPNGIYRGNVYVTGVPLAALEVGGSRFVVASGVAAKTSVEVTDIELKDYQVEFIRSFNTEECREIQIQTSIRNIGNVRVKPEMNIKIVSKDGSMVLQDYDYTGETMLPTTLENYMIRVPYQLEQFRCIPVGDYRAIVTYFVDGRQIDVRYVGVKIYERGALSISGQLIDLVTPSNVTLGEIIRINGVFKNTGQLPAKSKLTVEVYSGDRLIDTIEGQEKEVGIGKITNLTAYYEPTSAGKLLLKGGVWFEGKVSNIVGTEVEVYYPLIFWIGVSAAIVILILVAVFFLRRRMAGKPRKRRK